MASSTLQIIVSEETSSGEGGKSRYFPEDTRRRTNRFLPEGLQEEILVRLPVRSLVRFESVCKTWQSMLRSHSFKKLYRSRLYIDYSLDLHTTRKKDLIKMAPELSDLGLPVVLLASNTPAVWSRLICAFGPLSNGIYCLTSHLQDISLRRFSTLTGKIALCNPATNDYKFTNPFTRRMKSLLYHILLKPCQFNLVFDSGSKNSLGELDYKVVVLINYGRPFSSFLSLIYSFRSGKWKKIVDFKRGERNIGKIKAAVNVQVPYEVCPHSLFKGCWHWIAFANRQYESLFILSFNFADESFKLIAGPPRGYEAGERVYLTGTVFVLHDHLAVIQFFKTRLPKCAQVDVWMMKQYGVEDSWTKIYTVKPDFYGKFPSFVGIDSRLVRDEEKNGGIYINRLFFKDAHDQIIACDHNGYTVLSVWENSSSFICWNTPGISTYVKTLERL